MKRLKLIELSLVGMALFGMGVGVWLVANVPRVWATHWGPQCISGYCLTLNPQPSPWYSGSPGSYTGLLNVSQAFPPPGPGSYYMVQLAAQWNSPTTGWLPTQWGGTWFYNYTGPPAVQTFSFPGVGWGWNWGQGFAAAYWHNGTDWQFISYTETPATAVELPPPAPPTISLTANATTINLGQSTTFTLTVSGTATKCSAWSDPTGSGYINGDVSTTGGSVVASPTVSGTQFVLCDNNGSPSNTTSVAITVVAPPGAPSAPTIVPDNSTAAGIQQRRGDTTTMSWGAVVGATSYLAFVEPNSPGATSVCGVATGGCSLAGTQLGPGPNQATVSAGDFLVGIQACNQAGCSSSSAPLVNLTIQSNDAQFVSQKVKNRTDPASLSVGSGSTFPVEVTMKNIGTATWDDAGEYVLRSQNPPGNTTWGLSETTFAATSPPVATVAPNGTVTFTGTVVAPQTAGTYNFQWQMYRRTNTLGYFGQPSANVPITVTGPVVEEPITVRVRIRAMQDLGNLNQ